MSKESGEVGENSSEHTSKALHETALYHDVKLSQWPIIYSEEYNISFLGLEKLHPFDAGKWGKVFAFLKDAKLLRDDTTVRATEATDGDLKVVHTKDYINNLKWSFNVAQITEVPPVAFLPNFIVQRKVLRPFRFQTGGTILAGKLAKERGWAINIGGGFHHCSADRGGGFCAYADITLSIRFMFDRLEGIAKILIIDLDAHQDIGLTTGVTGRQCMLTPPRHLILPLVCPGGNGHERDFMDDDRVYIMDVYNRGIYPHDGYAKRAIKRKVELQHFTNDEHYLALVDRHTSEALKEFQPDAVVYNAGTDILEGDPLGNLSVTPQGIIERDRIVFSHVRHQNIPILMVTSGGYQRSTARIIADSILNLKQNGLIGCEEAEHAPLPRMTIPRSQSEGFLARLKRTCQSQPETNQKEAEGGLSLANHKEADGGLSLAEF